MIWQWIKNKFKHKEDIFIFPENLVWSNKEEKLMCKIHYPAHTIPLLCYGSIKEFLEDKNIKSFMNTHTDCV